GSRMKPSAAPAAPLSAQRPSVCRSTAVRIRPVMVADSLPQVATGGRAGRLSWVLLEWRPGRPDADARGLEIEVVRRPPDDYLAGQASLPQILRHLLRLKERRIDRRRHSEELVHVQLTLASVDGGEEPPVGLEDATHLSERTDHRRPGEMNQR